MLPGSRWVHNIMAVGRDGNPLDSQHSLRRHKFLCLAPIGGDDPQGRLPIGRASDDGESPAIREPTPTGHTNVAAGQLKTLETLGHMARLAPNNGAVRRKLSEMYLKLGMTDQGVSELNTLAELQLKAGLLKDAMRTYSKAATGVLYTAVYFTC